MCVTSRNNPSPSSRRLDHRQLNLNNKIPSASSRMVMCMIRVLNEPLAKAALRPFTFMRVVLILRLVMVVTVWIAPQYSAWAETATIIVRNMPIPEAAALAKSQLSPTGHIIPLPSRKALIIEDDLTHIRQARKMIRRVDLLEAPLSIQVDTEAYVHGSEDSSHASHFMLSGGWERVHLEKGVLNSTPSVSFSDPYAIQGLTPFSHFNLRLSPGKYGRMAIGEIRAIRPGVRRWLVHYGVADTPDMALVPVRAGLDIQAIWVDGTHVRLHIRPWIEQTNQKTDIQAEMGILPKLGTIRAAKHPPGTNASMWAYITPRMRSGTVHIELTDAETELLIKLKKTVVLAATADAAAAFSQALLSPHLVSGKPELRLRVKISRSP